MKQITGTNKWYCMKQITERVMYETDYREEYI